MEGVNQGQQYTSPLLSRKEIAPGIFEISIVKPDAFDFVPGQFIRCYLGDTPRDYTIVSPAKSDSIDFCIAQIDGGRFSTFITTCPRDQQIQFSGPHGHFMFQNSPRPSIFVATGTGVAPFVAFCRSGRVASTLLHGVSGPDLLIYRDVLEGCFEKYVPCISRREHAHNSLDAAYPGRVTDYLKKMLAPGAYDFYVCGQRNMVADVTALVDDTFDGSRLFIENFG